MQRVSIQGLRFIGALAVSVVLTSALAGCQRSDQSLAEDAARSFVDALNKSDREAVRAVLTAKSQEQVKVDPKPVSGKGPGDYTVGPVTITNDSAVVSMTPNSKSSNEPTLKSVMLRREDKQWRVYGVAMVTADGPDLKVDFEHPEATISDALQEVGKRLGSVAAGVGKGMGQMIKGIGDGFRSATVAPPRAK